MSQLYARYVGTAGLPEDSEVEAGILPSAAARGVPSESGDVRPPLARIGCDANHAADRLCFRLCIACAARVFIRGGQLRSPLLSPCTRCCGCRFVFSSVVLLLCLGPSFSCPLSPLSLARALALTELPCFDYRHARLRHGGREWSSASRERARARARQRLRARERKRTSGKEDKPKRPSFRCSISKLSFLAEFGSLAHTIAVKRRRKPLDLHARAAASLLYELCSQFEVKGNAIGGRFDLDRHAADLRLPVRAAP
eukprot:4884175-Pleurochrysis_carterae.AAC.1